MTRRIGSVSAAALLPALLLAGPLRAQAAQERVTRAIEARQERYADVARAIWGFAEVGYQEEKSSALLQAELKEAGFEVTAGVADIPTAFVASYGKGGPVIGILAEYDALPGLSQDSVPERKALLERGPGHGCGHNLFGTASTAAAIAVKEWLASSGRSGTIRLYGTPAEEGGSGKVYMVRAGLFRDVDVVLSWHPGDENDASPETTLANKTAKFRFHGVSAHASGAPHRGRSALDGVEAMTHMVNLMREHVPQETRIHYIITQGGGAPNVVPDFSEIYLYVRHPDARMVEQIFERVVKAAEGAATGTETTMDYEVIGGVHSLLPNETLARVVDANLRKVGGVRYTAADREFARKLQLSLGDAVRPIDSALEVRAFEARQTTASTDAGDVSWNVPSASLSTATWVPGTAAHSWQAVAAGATAIGTNGMLAAAKALARSAVDLYLTPATIVAARAEFDRRRGAGFQYRALLGDRKPALDYRK